MNLYRQESSDPKDNAQRNLMGRTHYVDDDTLRWHKSRILSARHSPDGLLFYIVESCALDMNNRSRGFRYVIFNLFGEVISRPDLEHCERTSEAATKAMYRWLDTVDALAITHQAIEHAERNHALEMAELRVRVAPKAA